jgi:cytoskeletal protein CcmA (bactofilin family)
MAANESENSVIGEGSIFEGQFFIAGNLRIDGKFDGDIKTENTLLVGPSGKVKTNNIQARQVQLSGTMIGNIDATEEVKVSESGRLLGNINAPNVVLAQGVVIKGNINITGGHKKDLDKLITDSFDMGKSVEDSKNTEKE